MTSMTPQPITFNITIRDADHFYKIVRWLNEHVGRGTANWTIEGRVLRNISNAPLTRKVIIKHSTDFHKQAAVFLALL